MERGGVKEMRMDAYTGQVRAPSLYLFNPWKRIRVLAGEQHIFPVLCESNVIIRPPQVASGIICAPRYFGVHSRSLNNGAAAR